MHTRTPEEVFSFVCVWRGVFEEMMQVLKILLCGSKTREYNAGAIEIFDDGASHMVQR